MSGTVAGVTPEALQQAEAALKSCPFCAGHASLAIGQHAFVDAKVVCDDCSAEGPLMDDNEDDVWANIEAATSHWNRRAA